MKGLSVWLRRGGGLGQAIIANAGAMVGTTAVTSGLGYLYWLVAAHAYAPTEVGLAAAAVSAMLLLGNVAVMGLGTLLMGELPRRPGEEATLIGTALLVAAIVGLLLGFLFTAAPHLSAALRFRGSAVGARALFALGVSLSALALVIDQALIGLLRGELQLGRNTLFAVAKLGVLAAVGRWAAHGGGMAIYATWAAGNLISLAVLAAWAARRRDSLLGWRPRWALLRTFSRPALMHHALNLALQVPSLALPLVVTALLTTTANAYFYAAWMMAGFVFVVPLALTTALYAAGSRGPAAQAHYARLSFGLSLGTGVLAEAALLAVGRPVLGFFGEAYAAHAESSLLLLVLGVFPLTIKYHYVATCRLRGRLGQAGVLATAGAVLELAAAALGTHANGLTGLSAGWGIALCIEAASMAWLAYPLNWPRRAGSRFASRRAA